MTTNLKTCSMGKTTENAKLTKIAKFGIHRYHY
jgi:hypothetical protein